MSLLVNFLNYDVFLPPPDLCSSYADACVHYARGEAQKNINFKGKYINMIILRENCFCSEFRKSTQLIIFALFSVQLVICYIIFFIQIHQKFIHFYG